MESASFQPSSLQTLTEQSAGEKLKIPPTEFKGAKRFFTRFFFFFSRRGLLSKLNPRMLLRPSHKFWADLCSTTLSPWAFTKAKHRTVWWAGLCLYLLSLEIWLWGQQNIRSQDSLTDWALRTGCHCVCSVSLLWGFMDFFSVLLGIVCAKRVHQFKRGHSEMI